MRLFILGATGGIGRQLVDQALDRRHRVTAFVRSPKKLGATRDGLTVIPGDVRDADAMRKSHLRSVAAWATIWDLPTPQTCRGTRSLISA